ncbi:MAG: hypothetical protein OHK0039_01820 [Bacteroidia bacterium]
MKGCLGIGIVLQMGMAAGQDSVATTHLWVQEVLVGAEQTWTKEEVKAMLGERISDQGLWQSESVGFSGKLLSFELRLDSGTVHIVWETGSEYNTAFFAVERRQPEGGFATIHIVPAAGTSRTLRIYRIRDAFPLGGVNTYRIRQVDLNGQVHYSQSRQVELPSIYAD